MDKFKAPAQYKCNVVSSPGGGRPVVFRELPMYPVAVLNSEPAISEFRSDGNVIEQTRMGETLKHLILKSDYFHEDDDKFFEELARRELPVYIYSGVPGSIQHHIPLVRGIGGDPTNGTYTATLATGSKVFMPRGDTAYVAYLEETDFANQIILANGVQNHSGLLSTLSNELPLGRGACILNAAKNWIKNSGFADDGTDIYNWTWGGTADGMDRRITNGWLGVPSLQIWGTTYKWTSDTFACATMAEQYVAISFGWKTDGEIYIEWNDSSGGGWGELVTLDKGSGYYHTSLLLPAIAANFQLRFSLASGTYGEFCAPQIIGAAGADRKWYPAYVEGLGEDVQGEITACSLKYTGNYEAGMWDASPTDDSALIVSGYIMPLVPGAQMANTQKLFTLYNSLTDKELELHMNKGGSTVTLFLRSNATDLCNVEIDGAAIGDTIFVAMVVGWNAGTATHAIYAQIVGGSTLETASYTTGDNFYTYYNEFYLGTDHAGNYGANALFQDVSIWAGTISPCCAVSTMVGYMADTDMIKTHKDTLGRKYRLIADLSPNPTNEQRYEGTVTCRNVEAL